MISKPKDSATSQVRLIGRRASEVEPQNIDWLRARYIARGIITIVEADPGVGKSPILIDLTSAVTRGRNWPDDASLGICGENVLILGAEDPEGTITRPRLD